MTSIRSATAAGLPTNRRGFIASLATAPAAIVAAAAVPALASVDHPDAELLGLRAFFERTRAEMQAVSPDHDRAESAYFVIKAADPTLDERTLRKRSGLIPAERAYYRALNRNCDVVAQIAATPARSLSGAVFKARISRQVDNSDPDLIESLVDDLIAMGGLDA